MTIVFVNLHLKKWYNALCYQSFHLFGHHEKTSAVQIFTLVFSTISSLLQIVWALVHSLFLSRVSSQCPLFMTLGWINLHQWWYKALCYPSLHPALWPTNSFSKLIFLTYGSIADYIPLRDAIKKILNRKKLNFFWIFLPKGGGSYPIQKGFSRKLGKISKKSHVFGIFWVFFFVKEGGVWLNPKFP